MTVIDFHAHAFPDPVAAKAMPFLEAEADIKAALDGTVGALKQSMAEAGVDYCVLSSIATKPAQFEAILEWSKSIRSETIIPFCSIHPDHPEAPDQVRRIQAQGFKGIKLHPYYQGFSIDEERMFPIYEAIRDCGLILLCHAGFDIAYPYDRIADPVRTRRVLDQLPDLKLVAAHVGAWDDWDEVKKYLLGREVYIDLSYSLHMMEPEHARDMIRAHPIEYVLFGTDSPWAHPKDCIAAVKALNLGQQREEHIFWRNAARLLDLEGR